MAGNKHIHTHRSLVAVALVMFAPIVMAQADCSKEIKEIDERIASGNYPDQNVQVAQQLQGSLQQMCAFLDDATKASFMEQVEDILPTKSKEERLAERRARSKELKAQREARKRDKAAAEAQAALARSDVLSATPTARSNGGQFIDRPDPMYHLWIWDWDTFRDKLRIAYVAFPDRTQLGLPDWKSYIYVVEVAADGAATQHMVTSDQAMFNYGGLAFRRGYDEILFHRRTSEHGKLGTLERWSISGKRQLSTVPAPNPKWPDGSNWDWGPFRVATSDGNVLFSQSRSLRGSDRKVTGWFESSPDGRVLGQGLLSDRSQDYGVSAWFRTNNGGGGLVLDVANYEAEGIRSAVATPVRHEIGGRKIHATVGREKRLLVTNDNAATTWESAAVERDMGWGGELGIPNDLPPNERMNQSNEYLELTRRVADEQDANRSVTYLNVGAVGQQMIKPMRNGYGVLVEVTANRRLQPPIHGPYFLTVDTSGVEKKAYLEPYAEQLNAKFTMLGISENDDVYLHAHSQRNQDTYVIRLDREVNPDAWGRTAQGRNIVLEAMAGDAVGAWVFGHAYRDKNKARLWVERIEFP